MKNSLLASLLFTFILSFSLSFSQVPQLTRDTQISIITIGQGNTLSDSFGHNGFRVKNNFLDVIYDYGRYPFNDPNFLLNFTQGKLNYAMGADNTRNIIAHYKQQNRSIKEQVLDLNETQKEAFLNYLANNYKPENKSYLYDFFFDNCATKIRDVSEKVLTGNINYKTPKIYKAETFRQLIQNNLYWNSWGSFGIDIALGSIIDQKATTRDYMFLPENIFWFFENASFKNSGKPLVKKTNVINTQKGAFTKGNFFISPIFVLSIFSIFILFITYNNKKTNTQTKWLDAVLFTTTGIVGVLLLLLWFATDHAATAQNYNLLWACPISIIALFQVFKNKPKRWFIGYLKLLIILLSLLTLHWFIGVQVFASALIPLLVALAVRYVFLVWFFNQKTL